MLSPLLMRSLLEVVLSVLLLLGDVSPEERYPFHPQFVEMKSDNPLPVQVVTTGQELPEK